MTKKQSSLKPMKLSFGISAVIFFVMAVVSVSCISSIADKKADKPDLVKKGKAQWVNPFIGTGGHGHTFPGATLPHGMVQLSPDTRLMGWDACSGYHFSDSVILGFSHTHLSGTGIGDYGDVLFMPTTGNQRTRQGSNDDPDSGYASPKLVGSEFAEPGYYSVVLKDYDVKAELTTTTRAGFHRYTYNREDPGMIIDLSHTLQNHKQVENVLEVINNNEVRGVKRTEGWAKNHTVFFHAVFSSPFEYELTENGAVAKLKFGKDISEVLVKVGISSVDYDGARNNLLKEIPAWDFDKVRFNALDAWEENLAKIDVTGGTEDEKTMFYTALYHTAIAPYTFSDVDGRYRGIDQKIHQSNEEVYTVFSLWDTYRAVHPLYTIIAPSYNEALIRTLLKKYQEGGLLPKWELAANFTGTMIGYHAVSVISDAYTKGHRDFDIKLAYEAIKKSAHYDTAGVYAFNEHILNKIRPKALYFNDSQEYIPSDLENESVAKALEMAYNDWCIAQVAKDLGEQDDYEFYLARSKRFSEYFDPQTGFMRGKLSNGQWREPFNPKASNHRRDDYCEGNAWQWTWYVPHDIEGLIELFGSQKAFEQQLDLLFAETSEQLGDETSSDISGLIGQYAHGNEPSHHITYMYNYINKPEETQKLTREVLNTLYFNNPNGLSGNEDCGQMSAWYVMSAMGIYQVAPGKPEYALGLPLFDEIKIKLENGQTFTISKDQSIEKNDLANTYELNKKTLSRPFIEHAQIESGGSLIFKHNKLN